MKKNKLKRRKRLRLGRNDPCLCGSDKKYKKCCLLKKWEQEKADSTTIEKVFEAAQKAVKEANKQR